VWEPASGNGLTTFHLEHRQTGDTQVLGGWGYVWGAFLGPVYLLLKGFVGLALLMVPISFAVFATSGLLAIAVALWSDSPTIRTFCFVSLVAMAFAVHGYLAVQLLRQGYLRRGYREGYY
jgi:hypothetical protein